MGYKDEIDRTGQIFGRLTCLYRDAGPNSVWICQCDCGNFCSRRAWDLVSGVSKSCGKHRFKGHEEISQGYWYRIVSKAEQRSIPIEIDITQIWNLFLKQSRKCALSGVDLVFVRNIDKYWLQTASLDRINSKDSYNINNIQWIHKEINQLKADIDDREFIFWCNTLSKKSYDISEYIIDNNYVFRYSKKKSKLYKEMSMRYWEEVKKSAKRRNIPFHINEKIAYSLLEKQDFKCAITNVPIRLIPDFRYNACYQTASLDRIDSSLPYQKDNVQWVHKRINRIKHKHSLDYLLDWAQLVSNYQEIKEK